MKSETIKNNIDRKIERFLKEENLEIAEIVPKLELTRDNLKKILTADTNSSARNHMISMYTAFSDKRIQDLQWAVDELSTNIFFAGIDDLNLFNLIRLRDKISQNALDSELY